MKIIVLDGHSINPGDLSWDALERFGSVDVYDDTDPSDVLSRIADAQIVLQSKQRMNGAIFDACPKLRLVCEMATGYDNVDVDAARRRGIGVCNIPAYSTDAVAQHTVALMLELSNAVALHSDSVHSGDWSNAKYFCYWKRPVMLLKGRSIGIIGYGNIGRRVAAISESLGMDVHVYHRDPEAAMRSDIVSLHCPATDENRGFVNSDFMGRMKRGAYIINTARGALINEGDVASALHDGTLAGYATDVLSSEPPDPDNPLLGAPNCIITPHIAWSPEEMRLSVINTCADNIRSYIEGGRLNRVD